MSNAQLEQISEAQRRALCMAYARILAASAKRRKEQEQASESDGKKNEATSP